MKLPYILYTICYLLIAVVGTAHADDDDSDIWAVRDISSGKPTQFWFVNRSDTGIWAVRNLSTGEPFRYIWVNK